MQKLKLDLDAIKVESFQTEAVEGAGTVRGHDSFEVDDQPSVLSCQGGTCKTDCGSCRCNSKANTWCYFSCQPCVSE